jgi:hypothetical protein
MARQQAGENGLAHARVRSRDDKNGAFHRVIQHQSSSAGDNKEPVALGCGAGTLGRIQPFVFMSKLVDSSDRGPVDYVHFAAVFFGIIISLAGIIATTPGLAVVGLLMIALGIAWFLVRN